MRAIFCREMPGQVGHVGGLPVKHPTNNLRRRAHKWQFFNFKVEKLPFFRRIVLSSHKRTSITRPFKAARS